MELDSKANRATPGSPTDSLVDDWVQPFGCNHVVVSVNTEDLRQDKAGDDSISEGKSTTYCVMCGENVTDVSASEDSKLIRISTEDSKATKKARKKEKKLTRKAKELTRSADDTAKDKESDCSEGDKTKSTKLQTKDFDFPEATNPDKTQVNAKDTDLNLANVDSITGVNEKVRERKRQIFEKRASSRSLLRPTSSASCSMHSHKKVKYFCEDHQELCCSVCVNVLHPKCDRVMFIRDVLNEEWDKQISDETVDALGNLRSSLQLLVELNQHTLDELETQKKDVKERQDALRTKLLSLLDKMEKSSEKKIERFMKSARKEITSNIDSCSNAISAIDESCAELQEVSSGRSPAEVFVTSRKVLSRAESYNTALSDVMRHTKDLHIEFEPETDIGDLESLERLGRMICRTVAIRFPDSMTDVGSNLPETEVRSARSVKSVFYHAVKPSSICSRQVVLQGKYNVRLHEDKYTCENVGCTFLQDGRVAITDMKNCKLKIFDAKFRQGCALKLSSAPRDVTVVSPIEVAVSLPDEGKIDFISVSKAPKRLRSIRTSIPCYGITHYNQELVVLCDDGFSTVAVQVLGLEGEVKRTVSMGKTGRVILKNPWYLTLNPDGQQICVTDRSRIVCMDIEGTVLFQYTDESLENARGVTNDPQGNLFVCGTTSNNVHHVSPEGSKVSILASDADITAPQAICYQPERRLLLVTSTGSDMLTLYKLATP